MTSLSDIDSLIVKFLAEGVAEAREADIITIDTLTADLAVSEATIANLTAALDALCPEVQATAADAFVDACGVNALFKNRTTVYGDVAAVVDRVVELGVRHIRDRLVPSQASQQAAYAALHVEGVGVHVTIGAFGDTTAAINTALAKAAEHPEFYTSFGGPNEPNAAGGSTWPAKTVAHQKALFMGAKGNPKLTNIPIVGPALKDNVPDLAGDFAKLKAAGIEQWIDHSDFHIYPGGITPTNGLDDRVGWATSLGHSTFNTESGYNTGLGITGHGNPIPEDVQAIYAPRQLLEHYTAGVARSFTFELLDDPDPQPFTRWESHFGLIACPAMAASTWRPKPAYSAVQRLLTELADPGDPYTPPPLRMALDGDVRWHLFGKRDGTCRLALWQDATVYDVQTKQPIAVDDVPVTVRTLTQDAHLEVGADVTVVTLTA